MCGIAGLVALGGEPLPEPDTAAQMAGLLVHRGPDGEGSFHDESVAFGFRRLSIIDVEGGEQPLYSEDRQIVAMVNGEIYDFVETRELLRSRGHVFATESDAEVAVHAYEEWGLDFVSHLRGMFAIALWDAKAQRLVLARDRLGQKPLYWSLDRRRGELAFASETNAFAPWRGFDPTLDRAALDEYLTFLYVPCPRSIYRSIRKLPPAHLLVVDTADALRDPDIVRYWQPALRPGRRSPDETDQLLRETLAESVRLRLRSDVPLGTFLSGGIDSTLITALAAQHGAIDSFSLGFEDPRFDESRVARKTAAILGTRHHEVRLDADSFAPSELAQLVTYMDEPFADSSFLPTYWLSRFARENVTVALSGDGGDELFAGYTRYLNFRRLERLATLPSLTLSALAGASEAARKTLGWMNPALAERVRQLAKAARLARRGPAGRILGLLEYFDLDEKRRLLTPEWCRDDGGSSEQTVAGQLAGLPEGRENPEALDRFLLRDLGTNLVDDALVKVDRASMACSLEVRSPMLDHRFVELALTLPVRDKLKSGVSKQILRRAFADWLPEHVLSQPKRGFEVPFARWFARRDWRDLLVDALNEPRLRRQGIFQPGPVVALRDEILRNPEAKGLALSAYQLRHRVWILLVFQVWLDVHGRGEARASA